jgi:hypothetical protein
MNPSNLELLQEILEEEIPGITHTLNFRKKLDSIILQTQMPNQSIIDWNRKILSHFNPKNNMVHPTYENEDKNYEEEEGKEKGKIKNLNKLLKKETLQRKYDSVLPPIKNKDKNLGNENNLGAIGKVEEKVEESFFRRMKQLPSSRVGEDFDANFALEPLILQDIEEDSNTDANANANNTPQEWQPIKISQKLIELEKRILRLEKH